MSHKLLLADDSVTIQRVIELTFADEDVDVVAVSDGAQAIEQIKSAPPDIVLADTGMPERDGYEVAEFVKGDTTRRHIPVLLLTGAFEPLDEARAQSIGCNGYLVKPFEPQQVVSKVRELLQVEPLPEVAAEEAPTPPPLLPAEAGTDSMAGPVPGVQTGNGEHDELAELAAPSPTPATPVDEPTTVSSDLGDDELSSYLDQLDEAFASLETPAKRAPRAAAPPAPALPVEASAAADTEAGVTTPESSESGGPSEQPASEAGGPSELLAEDWDLHSFVAPPVEPAPELTIPVTPLPPPVAPLPPPTVPSPPPAVEELSPSVLEASVPLEAPPPILPATEPTPPVVEPIMVTEPPPPLTEPAPLPSAVTSPSFGPPPSVPPPPPAAGEHTVLAQAFTTFLAAESGASLPEPPATATGGGQTLLPLTDSQVDELVSRVVQRLTDQVLRDTTAEIVSRVAEQLVREEIDRIKANVT